MIIQLRKVMIYPINHQPIVIDDSANSMAVFVYLSGYKVAIDSFPMTVFNKLLDQGLKNKNI